MGAAMFFLGLYPERAMNSWITAPKDMKPMHLSGISLLSNVQTMKIQADTFKCMN
jgi:hypothetical protein